MCGNLLGSIRTAYLVRHRWEDQWGCDVVRKFHVPLHQYRLFQSLEAVCSGAPRSFTRNASVRCVAQMRPAVSLTHWKTNLTRNGDGANRVVVKMDVEGAEWDTLRQAPAALLERIDQLVLELHGIGLATSSPRCAG